MTQRSTLLHAFYFVVYVVLKLLRIVSSTASGALTRLQFWYASCNHTTLWLNNAQVQTPNHVALSGAIADQMPAVWKCVQSLISQGTTHITLHDPNHNIHVREVEQFVQTSHKSMVCRVRQIGSKSTVESVYRRTTDSSVHAVEGMNASIAIRTCNEETGAEFEVVLTIVEARSGVSLMTRAARALAYSSDIQTSLLSADTVTEWLDADSAKCMLPSEPDVVIVFPQSFSSWAPILDGFPVWQLRLSQIVFAKQPMNILTAPQLLRLVEKASSAPKRFGR